MVNKLYICPQCEEDYLTERNARYCCAIKTNWECCLCDTVYTTKHDADNCCGEEYDDEDDEDDD